MTSTASTFHLALRDAAQRAGAERFSRFLVGATFLYPVLWAIGIAGAYWVIVGIAATAYLLRTKVQGVALLPLLIALTLLISSGVGIAAFGLDFGRLASLLGNLFIWTSLAAAVSAAAYADFSEKLARAIVTVGIAQGLVTAAAMIAYPAKVALPLLSPIASSLPSGFAAFSVNKLYMPDWLAGRAFRSAGMMGQPTWGGAFSVGVIFISITLLFNRQTNRKWRILSILGIAAGYLGYSLSLSRSAEISIVVGAVAALLVFTRRRSAALFYPLTTIMIFAAIAIAIGAGSSVISYVNDVNEERAGSLTARSSIYAATVENIQRLGLPIIGYGIKPQEDGLVASIATHSAYLGMVFRAGIIGLALFLVFLLILLLRAYRERDITAAAIMAFTLVWCILEDFDPGHLLPLVVAYAFSRVGYRSRIGT